MSRWFYVKIIDIPVETRKSSSLSIKVYEKFSEVFLSISSEKNADNML